jgi:hypothetical protein
VSRGRLRGFALLSREAVGDAVRRRVVAVIAAVSVLSLLWIDSCTSCAGGSVVVNGVERDLAGVAGWTGAATFAVLALWGMALAGVLASEHLTQPLDDGSATLCLARPVGRGSFVFARLAGALVIALATGGVLLAATALLLSLRTGLPWAPAVAGMAAFAAGAVTVAALAMACSLALARIGTVLLVLAALGLVALANGIALAGGEPGGMLGVVDRFGPPLLSALAAALAPWLPQVDLELDAASLVFRLVAWAGGSLVLLWAAFARVPLGRERGG